MTLLYDKLVLSGDAIRMFGGVLTRVSVAVVGSNEKPLTDRDIQRSAELQQLSSEICRCLQYFTGILITPVG